MERKKDRVIVTAGLAQLELGEPSHGSRIDLVFCIDPTAGSPATPRAFWVDDVCIDPGHSVQCGVSGHGRHNVISLVDAVALGLITVDQVVELPVRELVLAISRLADPGFVKAEASA